MRAVSFAALLSMGALSCPAPDDPPVEAAGEGEGEGEGEAPELRGFGGRCDQDAQCESERCLEGFCSIYCNQFTTCPDGYSCHEIAEGCIVKECDEEDRCTNGEVCRIAGTCSFTCERPRSAGEECSFFIEDPSNCFPVAWPCEPAFECAPADSGLYVAGECVIPAGEGESCRAPGAPSDKDGCLDGLSCVPLEPSEPRSLAFCRNL